MSTFSCDVDTFVARLSSIFKEEADRAGFAILRHKKIESSLRLLLAKRGVRPAEDPLDLQAEQDCIEEESESESEV